MTRHSPRRLRVAVLAVSVLASPAGFADNGSWAVAAPGDWSNPSQWTAGVVADGSGFSATFACDLTAECSVTLDAPRTLGALTFADANPASAAGWDLAGPATLTLAVAEAAAPPALTVADLAAGQVARISAPLAGAAFTKAGAGTLELAGANNFTTPTVAFAAANAGALRLTSSTALGGITTVAMPGTNANVARIELAGNVTLTAAITTAGRNVEESMLRNLADSNTWNGDITITNTGGNYGLEAAAGTLTLGGTLATTLTTARAFTLSGAGSGVVSGVIANGSGTVGVTKTGAGTWTLLGPNTYSGATTLSAGQLIVGTGGQPGTGPILNEAQLAFTQANNLTVSNTISGSGSVSASGEGSLTLGGDNTYTGGTTLTGTASGRVSCAVNTALGTGLVTLGAVPGASQIWFHASGARTLANGFEIRTQRWIIDGNTINGNAAGPLTVTGAVHFNQAGAKDVYCNQPLTLAGPVTSTGGLTKMGGYLLTLTGAAAYPGPTSVAAGTLAIEGTLTSAGTTTVSSGSTLTGSGVLSGPVVINSGGKLTPGTGGTGKITTGALTLATTSELRITAGAPNDPGNSQLVINGNLNLNGKLQLIATTGFTSGSYTIATYTGTRSGPGFQSIIVPAGFMYSLDTTTPGQIKLQVLQAAAITPPNHIMAPLTESVALTWTPVPGAVAYDLYLGTNATNVGNATPSSNGIYLGRMTEAQYTAAGFAHGITAYWRVDYVLADGSVFKGQAWDFTLVVEQDLMADTWVATDALNRVLPDAGKVGPPRSDRPIAIFYFLWHTKNNLGSDGPRDNTREINRLGGYTDPHKPWADNPLWMTGSEGRSWYWGEPEAGYYSSDDEWVIRRHIALLVAAGVDILAFDNTNGHPQNYQAHYTKIAETIRKMRREGMKVDLKFLFITHGGVGGSPATMTWLYENLYKPGLYPELWLRWNGKPAMVGYPDGLSIGDTPATAEVRNFFTLRSGWANGSGGPNDWQWIDTPTPQNYGYGTRPDIPEQTPVACGGWCNGNLGRSQSNRIQPAYNNFHLTPAATEGQGKFFSEQTYYGLKLDPQLLFLTGWNEWWAGAWTAPVVGGGYKMMDNKCAIGQRYFVDNYNAEYSRDIEPMKGGFGDNYYYQMVAANRLRKGARPAPVASPARTITSPADFASVLPAYQDAPDETLPRNAPTTFSNLPNYTNTTGRNDFRVLKVARDASNLYFYAQTKAAITPANGSNWMLLFLDTDQNRATGWEGYDYAINLGGSGQLQHFADSSWSPAAAGGATVSVTGNQLMITVARASLGLTAEPLRLDFHWADNLQTLGDIADFGSSGDSAPERRFNYRYQTAPTEAVALRSDGFEPGDESAQGSASSWAETLSPGSQWKIAATTPYTGSQCLLGMGAATTTDASGALINPADTASLDSLRIAFRYKLTNVKDAQNIQIYYRNSSGQWISIRELGRDQFHASGQAWGYDERQNTWLYFADARLNAGTDAAYFHSQFAIQIQIKGLDSTTQTLALDDFQITGTRTILVPGAASGPTPSNGATAVSSPAALSWTPGAGATTQQVYFGTPGNLVLLGSPDGQAASQLLDVPPAAGTGWVWRVDTVNAAGTTPGPLWSFTTAAPPNQPPTLEGIADCHVIAGQHVAFTAIAADADSPAQTLTFGLQGAPEGAAIQPASGQFAWRPTQARAPGAYLLDVIVTDNGSPPLTAQRAFTIHVATPATPGLTMLDKSADGTFRFRVTGDAGPDYRVLISTDLIHWDLLQTLLAPTPPFLFEDPDAKNARSRFYRLELGP